MLRILINFKIHNCITYHIHLKTIKIYFKPANVNFHESARVYKIDKIYKETVFLL